VAAVEASSPATAARRALAPPPSPPDRLAGLDPGAIGSLVACTPLDLLAATTPACRPPPSHRQRYHAGGGRAVLPGHQPHRPRHLPDPPARPRSSCGPATAGARPARLDARRRQPHLDVARGRPPRLDGGCMGDGHHGWAGADLLTSCGTCWSARTKCRSGVVLASLVPEAWFGQGWEVHDAPTAHGDVSYAVRWHGDRVALLWEVEPHERPRPGAAHRPGLDPGWSTTGPARRGAARDRAPGRRGGGPGGRTRGCAGPRSSPRRTRSGEPTPGPRPRGAGRRRGADGPGDAGRPGRERTSSTTPEREGTLPLLAVERLIVPTAPVHDLAAVTARTGLERAPRSARCGARSATRCPGRARAGVHRRPTSSCSA
jgi:hypothetical protein